MKSDDESNSYYKLDAKVNCPKCKTLCIFDKQKNPYRPFCSERCKILDLGTWADEGYKIAAENTDITSEENPESDDQEK